MKITKLLLTTLLISTASLAQAGILELRGGVGMSASNPDDFEDRANAINQGGVELDELETFNADVFINLPALPIGFGVRQEWLNVDDQGNGGDDIELEATNLLALVDFRIIDSGVYLGPIIGVGHPSAKIDYKTSTFSVDDDLDADELSYLAGLEFGFVLGHFLIGTEAGYQSVKLKSADSPSIDASIDLSGFYGKVMLGLTFF